ncbi:MAG: hypothetical protein RR645_02010 [Clostridium sp.]
MEPEMYESMLSCKKLSSNDNVNVIIQLSRADKRIAELMRPNETFTNYHDNWTGTRRFYISK